MQLETLEQPQETNAFGADKVARYGWATVSDRGKYQEIDKRILKVNREVYQRDSFKSKVLELASNWSWISCGALTVARRNGVYWVVDGAHRREAAMRRSDITDMPCIVFDVADIQDEARAFLATNANRKPVTALAKFKARIAAGDKAAMFVADLITSLGLRLATASSEAGDFKAVAMALDLAERDRDGLVAVMRTAAELALAERGPVHKALMDGLYYIHTHVDGGLDGARLSKRLRQVGMAMLIKGAQSAHAYYGKGGAKIYADGMLQCMNKGLRTRFEFAA